MQVNSFISFTDTNFLTSQWTTESVPHAMKFVKDCYFDSTANTNVSREPSGGKELHLPFRQSIFVWGHKNPQLGKHSYVAIAHVNNVATVLPRVLGGIKKIDFSFDVMCAEGDVTYALLAQQNDKLFIANKVLVKHTKGLWKRIEKQNVTAKDFEELRIENTEPTLPNFKYGTPIKFGYLTMSTTNKIAQSISGMAEFRLNVHAACASEEQDESDEETSSEIIAIPTDNCNISNHIADLQRKLTEASTQVVTFHQQKKALLELKKVNEEEIEQLKKELERVKTEFSEYKAYDIVPVDKPEIPEDGDDFVQIDVAPTVIQRKPVVHSPVSARRVPTLAPATVEDILAIKTSSVLEIDTDSDSDDFVEIPRKNSNITPDEWERL
jgi:hypothetical protein